MLVSSQPTIATIIVCHVLEGVIDIYIYLHLTSGCLDVSENIAADTVHHSPLADV